MALRWALVLIAVVGCKKSRKDECEELAKLGIAVAEELGKQLGGKGKSLGADPEIKAKMAELQQQCMAWPDEVFECMRANDETSPKCREAMSHVTGVVSTDVDKAPDGPAIVASAHVGEGDYDGLRVSLAADGTLTAASNEWIATFAATGKETWRAALPHGGWFVDIGDGFLVGDRMTKELVVLDAKTGAERSRIELLATDEYSSPSAEAAVRVGDRVMLAMSDGRFLRFDPAACKKQKSGCLELAFEFSDESFTDPQLLALGDDILVGESEVIRRFTQDGKVRASIDVRDSFGGIALLGGERIAATMDDELVLWDLAKCPSTSVVLPRKQGRMYIKGDGECEDCIAPPTGCLVARSELKDVESTPPFVLRDGSLMVSNLDGPARAAVNGNKHWASEVDAVGVIREAGDTVVFVSRGDDGKPAKLVALDTKTGKAKWKRALTVKSDDISYTFDTIVEVNGNWLVAGAKGHVSWIKLSTKI